MIGAKQARPTQTLMCLLVLVGSMLEARHAVGQTDNLQFVTRHTEWARMRDGILLPSDVYFAKGCGRPAARCSYSQSL